MPDRTCSIDGCERPARTKGMCQAHYVRSRRGKDLTKPLRPYVPGVGCSVADCDRIVQSRGMCKMHVKRDRVHGDPFHEHPRPNNWHGERRPGELNGNYKGADIDYFGAHHRVHRLRGQASAYACQHCGCPAEQWAYDHTDSAEKTGGLTGRLRYSTDPDRYIPLCVPCHTRFDKRGT